MDFSASWMGIPQPFVCVWAGRARAMDECDFLKIFFYIVAGIVVAVSSLVIVWCCLYKLWRPADNPILNEIDGMEVAGRPQQAFVEADS